MNPARKEARQEGRTEASREGAPTKAIANDIFNLLFSIASAQDSYRTTNYDDNCYDILRLRLKLGLWSLP